MSLFSALRTSVTGMNAQSSYLSAIGDNIANSSTTGYKDASTQFETVLGEQTPGSYESGGVLAQTRYGVTSQGTINATTSSTDLAINGQGFFLVSNSAAGTGTSLTRAGSFVPDQNGNLVNTAGYYLQGYKIGTDGKPSTELSTVNISSTKLQAVPTTTGTVSGNLPSTDTTASLAETTTATLFDTTGAQVTANISFKKNSDGTWDVSATDAGGNDLRSPAGTAQTVSFDASGQLISANGANTSLKLSLGSTSPITLDLSNMTSLATGVGITHDVTGSAPTTLASVVVGTDGTLTGVYGSGAKANLYDIPVATVTSPDNLTSITGDVYQLSQTSGPMTLQSGGTGSAGTILADNLEASTVDLATELTNMIVAQRSYEANSKVLQAASDLLSKLDQIQTG